ncbi:tumor necrosis factor receptor superfamily member 1A-like [Sturnira hondurensis]|uniref:tumor necrosis factor receptor superfamily member 1A-like n=1 Tax=Sturnira hondurensis TaxID=192404 RepID=UPI001879DB8D|nr:tumor necrosis factor receptor superfamily member 1A-like [Sturnira hondurensis]
MRGAAHQPLAWTPSHCWSSRARPWHPLRTLRPGSSCRRWCPQGAGPPQSRHCRPRCLQGPGPGWGRSPPCPGAAMNRIYFEFGQEVPKSHWRMFMRLAGLEENDIVICEHENPGNLREQHHTIATPSRLMTALCQMRLRECLENITNKLVAEDILGSKDAEPPN